MTDASHVTLASQDSLLKQQLKSLIHFINTVSYTDNTQALGKAQALLHSIEKQVFACRQTITLERECQEKLRQGDLFERNYTMQAEQQVLHAQEFCLSEVETLLAKTHRLLMKKINASPHRYLPQALPENVVRMRGGQNDLTDAEFDRLLSSSDILFSALDEKQAVFDATFKDFGHERHGLQDDVKKTAGKKHLHLVVSKRSKN